MAKRTMPKEVSSTAAASRFAFSVTVSYRITQNRPLNELRSVMMGAHFYASATTRPVAATTAGFRHESCGDDAGDFLVSRVRLGFQAFLTCAAYFDSPPKTSAASARRWANLRALENDAQARMRMKRSSPRSSLSTSSTSV